MTREFGTCEVCGSHASYPTGEMIVEGNEEREKYLCLHHGGAKKPPHVACQGCGAEATTWAFGNPVCGDCWEEVCEAVE